MTAALINAYLDAKLREPATKVALYAVSSDVDGASIVQEMGIVFNRAIGGMLATTAEPLTTDPHFVASMLQGVMGGVSRRLLESSAPAGQIDAVRQELIVLTRSYLKACAAEPVSLVTAG